MPRKNVSSASAAIRRVLKCIGSIAKWIGIIILVLALLVFLQLQVGCRLMSDVVTISPKTFGETHDWPIAGYSRSEESTYLTFPEWYIVYSSEEYANFLEKGRPSQFPYFASIRQFWHGYCNVYTLTKDRYGFNAGNHGMLWVIGVSFSVEYAIKGIYENIIGRFTEWTSSYEKTEEDFFAYRANKEYVAFIYDRPWYEFSFAKRLWHLWADVPSWGEHMIRKSERKLILGLEFGIKAIYGGLIELGTHATYGSAATEIYATVQNASRSVFEKEPRIRKVQEIDTQFDIISIPRYRLFTEIVPALTRQGVQFVDIAGNDEIFFTAIAPRGWNYDLKDGEVLFTMNILTQPWLKRIAVQAPVESLHEILPALEHEGVKIEHIYDY